MSETFRNGSFRVEHEDGVLKITLDRPEFGNAVPSEDMPSMKGVFDAAKDDASVRAVLIRGEGGVFSAGGDLGMFARSIEVDKATRQADFAARLPLLQALAQTLIDFEKPLIVAMRGAVAGAGLLYPLAADIVIGAPEAVFLFAHQRTGLSPDGGVTVLLPLVTTPRTARRLLLTGAVVKSAEALTLGLLSEIVETGALDEHAMRVARRIAHGPQLALRLTKRLLGQAANGASIPGQLANEVQGIIASVGDDDFAEGVKALVEKRTPIFPSTL